MATERQINANRANAAKSTGPVSRSGKKKSARNSTRHGMLARKVVLIGESTFRFNELVEELKAEFQPQTRMEEILVESMIVALWRQRRLWSMENAGLSHEIYEQETAPNRDHLLKQTAATRAGLAFRSLADRSRALDLINRYDTRYDRQYQRALAQLLELREKKQILPNEPNLKVS
jgi:hypothetical protein